VALDQLGEQIRRGVPAKVGGEIGHLDALIVPTLLFRSGLGRNIDLVLDPAEICCRLPSKARARAYGYLRRLIRMPTDKGNVLRNRLMAF
jgi:hypothetical protein